MQPDKRMMYCFHGFCSRAESNLQYRSVYFFLKFFFFPYWPFMSRKQTRYSDFSQAPTYFVGFNFFFSGICYLLVLHKQIQNKYSNFNQIPAYFTSFIIFSLAVSTKVPNGCLSSLFSCGRNSVIWVPAHISPRPLIKTETIVGTDCQDHRLCDVWA